MTKRELMRKVAEKAGTTIREAEAVVSAFFEELSDALKKGERFMIPGFGTFSVAKRKERKGRNPRTGEEITIPERKVVVFKMASALKEKMR